MPRSDYAQQRLLEVAQQNREAAEREALRKAELREPHPDDPDRCKDGTLMHGNSVGKLTPTKWPAGVSGNPMGKPRGSKNLLSKQFIADLSNVWRRRGREVLEELVTSNPAALAALASRYVPPESLVIDQKPATMAFSWAEGSTITRRIIDPRQPEAGQGEAERPQVITDLREARQLDVEPMEQPKRIASLPAQEERPVRRPMDYPKAGII